MTLGVVGLLLCAAAPLAGWHRAQFAEELARRAGASAGGAARAQVRRLSERGLDATAALVRLAGSASPDAAAAARNAVENQLEGWVTEFRATGDAANFGHRLAKVARALDASLDGFDETGRAWARRIALQLAPHCDQLAPRDAVAVLANCDLVLAAPMTPPAATAVAPDAATEAKTGAATQGVETSPAWRRFPHEAPAARPGPRTAQPLATAPVVAPGSPGGDVQFLPAPAPAPQFTLAEPVTPATPVRTRRR
jgi:hypothetical protein